MGRVVYGVMNLGRLRSQILGLGGVVEVSVARMNTEFASSRRGFR